MAFATLQDALFTRGTSATPDLPSAGKPRLPRGLFSPANLRSGTGSGGKVVPRRGLLHGADSPMGPCAQDTDDDRLGSQPSGEEGGSSNGAISTHSAGLVQKPIPCVVHQAGLCWVYTCMQLCSLDFIYKRPRIAHP